MPVKQDTELQLLRALSNTPLQVDVTFMNTKTHVSLNTPASHLNKFYTTFDEIKDRTFDGLIVTGAPVEDITFEEVDYWEETCKILDWAETHVTSTLHICWVLTRDSCHRSCSVSTNIKYPTGKYRWCVALMIFFWHRTAAIRRLRRKRFMPVRS